MNTSFFRAKSFTVEGSNKCACLITGYRGRISSYKSVIRILNERGYSVIAYEHTPAVLTSGKPELLLTLVAGICDDFSEKASGYREVICVGASIGAGLCFAIQRQFPNVKFGIYAGAGVSPPETIHEAPLFYFVRKKFVRLGYDRAELQKAWSEIDILPNKRFGQTPFIMALGKKDKIVSYDKALATIHSWQEKGQPIKIIAKSRLGHVGIIRWYRSHFSELLNEAESLTL